MKTKIQIDVEVEHLPSYQVDDVVKEEIEALVRSILKYKKHSFMNGIDVISVDVVGL